MPTSRWMSSDSAWLLMRADARGLSGMLTASTPTDFTNRAPSISLRMSIPFGGTISTIVTNSPCSELRSQSRPLLERHRRDRFRSRSSALRVRRVSFRAPHPTRRADFITRMCSGVVPQHPPTTPNSSATNFRA